MMSSRSQDTSKQRFWASVVLVLILATIALTGEFLRLRSERATSATRLEKLQAEIARRNARLELTDEQKAKRLERAKFLRGRWRVWALAHKDELKRMLDAQPDGQSAFKAVWGAIPTYCNPSSGISSGDLQADGDILHGEAFTWNAISKSNPGFRESPTADELSRLNKSQIVQTATQQADFKQLRDVVISQSVNQGTSSLCLWASGRITERRLIGGPPTSLSSSVSIPAQETQEIVPIYDFLKD